METATVKRILLLVIIVLDGTQAASGSELQSHGDPIAPTLLALVAILAAAKLGGELFERINLPSVLGELIGGIVLGNLVLLNPAWNFFEPLRLSPVQTNWAILVDGLARIGVIVLLFEVGLESTVKGMLKLGGSSTMVAVLGVVAPFILGFGASWLFITELPAGLVGKVPPSFSLAYIHLFIGAVLCATSVGITARVFKDLKSLQLKEAQIILGAAVIDDVLGLAVLAIVSGIVTAAEMGQPLAVGSIAMLIARAVLFLGVTLLLGVFLIPRIMRQMSRLRVSGLMLISSLIFAFALAYLADLAGLAPIVGAFAAGLLLEDVHFRGFREEIQLEQLIRPVSAFLVPVFFVTMGMQVRLESFLNWPVLELAAGLTVAAIVGKQVCGLGVLEKDLDRLTVGIGMIPRGEVGLIFASVGKSLNVIDDALYSAVVVMVIITTLITPPLLKLTLSARSR